MSQIVIEFGSAFIRAGVAGEAVPRTVVAVSAHDLELLKKGTGDELRLRLLEIFSQLFPFVTARRAKETRVLLLENPTERRVLRNAIADVLFRYYKIDYLCLYPSIVLSVIPTGLRTAILVDVGHNETRAVAVFDSRVLLPTLVTAPVGWQTLLERPAEEGGGGEAREAEHLDAVERSLLTEDAEQLECLRQLIGSGVWAEDEFRGVAGVLLDCLLRCPLDVSPAVVRHVVFSGGVSSIAGFSAQVAKVAVQNAMNLPRYNALRPLLQAQQDASGAPALTPEATCFPAHVLSWVGGSLLANCKGLGTRFVREADVRHTVDNSIEMPDWISGQPEDSRFLGLTSLQS